MPWAAAAGAVVGGVISAKGAKDAAKAGAGAADTATREQGRQFDITQAQAKPFREAGERGLARYEDMVGQQGQYESQIRSNIPQAFNYGGEQPESFQFNREDFNQYKDPGYEFRREEGMRGLDRKLARSGNRTSGYSSRALMELGQNLASQEFGAARGRAYQDYQSSVGREQEGYGRALRGYGLDVDRERAQYGRGVERYGRQYTDPMNRYASLANVGQTATTNLANQRGSYANQVASNTRSAGEFRAAGQLGQAGAVAGAIGGIGNAYSMYQRRSPVNSGRVAGDAYMPGAQFYGN